MIVTRYLTKEILWSFLTITAILLLIALSNRFAVYLAKAAAGLLPLGLVLKIVLLYIPELLGYLLPLALFISILLGYGRLYADNEMTILFACGMSWRYLAGVTLKVALVVTGGAALFTLWLIPWTLEHRERLIAEGEMLGVMQSLVPGRFQATPKNNMVFYIEEATPSKREGQVQKIKGVFIAENPAWAVSDPLKGGLVKKTSAIVAKSANLKKADNSHEFYLLLQEGSRYQGIPGEADYTVSHFQTYGRRFAQAKEGNAPMDFLRLKPTAVLWRSPNRQEQSEFQWRISFPLAVLVLALLAVPLSHVSPRQGRYAKILPAILLFILYYNGFTVAKRWVSLGLLPAWIGVWSVHAAFFLFGSGWIASRCSFRKLLKNKTFSLFLT